MGATAAVHPTEPTLQAYGLGKLDDASAESVNKHLSSCPECQSRVAEMSSDSFVGRLALRRARPRCRPPPTRNSVAPDEGRPAAAGSPPRPRPCRLAWLSTPITRSSESSAEEAWEWFTWPTTGSWVETRCSR